MIAVPAVELAEKVMQVGNSSGRDIDKFEAFDLTPVPAERVKPLLIAKCFANLECRVVDTRLVNKYCLFVLEVLEAWTDPTRRIRRPSTTAATARSPWTVRSFG